MSSTADVAGAGPYFMDDVTTHRLLVDLKNPDPDIRDRATQDLWESWFWQKGLTGMQVLQKSQVLLGAGESAQAEQLLNELLVDHPDFAEAWNRRAVLYYTRQDFHQSLEDCEQVLRLVPHHFGALHGMGLCYASLGEYRAAIQAFHRTLEVQPYAVINQKLLLECSARL